MHRVTTFTLRKGNPAKTRTDVVVVGVVRRSPGGRAAGSEPRLEAAAGGEEVAKAYGRRFTPLLSAAGFRAEVAETLRVPAGDAVRAGQLLLVGLGAADELDADVLRRVAGAVARDLGNAASAALALPLTDPADVAAVVEGFALGAYTFTRYKSGPAPSTVGEVALLSAAARDDAVVAAVERGEVLAAHVARARDWVNTPPNDLTPSVFADAVVALGAEQKGRGPKVEVEVLGPDELRALQCGGVLGVGQGSAHEPRMVRLTWAPDDAVASVALVGKGITYDSGGLTIKPGSSMATMKYDMGGAAAVLAATFAVGALGLPVAVTTYAPMAENMPSGSAMRPGDVLTMHDGQTVEVTNTDAEGRLLLADALAMAIEQQPDAVVDAATLTGACMVALGERYAGVFGHETTVADVLGAAEAAGELAWPMPIPEQSRTAVGESPVADVLQANWVRWGGASYAAAFLERFVGDTPWAHVDLAGPAWNSGGPAGHVTPGATGYGVTTLVAWVAAQAEQAGVAPEDTAGD